MNIKAALAVQNCIAGDYEKNMSSCFKLISKASQKNVEIIVFPEMNLTGYVSGKDIPSIAKPVSDDLVRKFSEKAKELNMTILAGIAEKSADKNIFASQLIFKPCGSFEKYRKIHTSPYEKKYLTAGNTVSVFESANITFGVQLCYDAHFPELTTAMALKKADIIFIPHASPRGSSREKYESWMRHLKARAFDNCLYIAACNQTGNNGRGLSFPGLAVLIGPDGKTVSKNTKGQEEVYTVDIDMAKLEKIKSHKMKYFLPNRRNDMFGF